MIRRLALLSVALAATAAAFIVSLPTTCWAGDVTLVKDLWPADLNSYPQGLTVMDGTLYFIATTDLGREL